jgi:aldehyde dehydrogenase (NAD+)
VGQRAARRDSVRDAQKSYFASGISRSYGWRMEQLDRMANLLVENEAALQEAVAADFKTASQEYAFETVALDRRNAVPEKMTTGS